MRLFIKTMLIAICGLACFTACSKDEPAGPSDDPVVNPPSPTGDPEGTVTVSIRNKQSGGGSINGDISIDQGDNFVGAMFVDMGEMQGIAGVTKIPKTGYASKVKVSVNHGYVAYAYGIFYRLFVVRYVTNVSDEIIGAEIKYQKPFFGVDESVKTDSETLSFGKEGGAVPVVFTNSTYVPAENISCDADWITLKRASTEENFIQDAIVVEAAVNASAERRYAEIEIVSHYNKTMTIKIIQEGDEPFLSFSKDNMDFTRFGGEAKAGILTNYKEEEVSVTSDQTWVKADIDRSSANSAQRRAPELRYIEGKRTYDLKQYSRGAAQSIAALISVEPNYDMKDREAVVKVRAGQNEAALHILQSRAYFYFMEEGSLSDDTYCIDAGWQENDYFLSMTAKDPNIEALEISTDKDWLTAILEPQNGDYNRIKISCQDNLTDEPRTGHITLGVSKGDLKRTIEIVQDKADMELSVQGSKEISLNRHGDKIAVNIRSHCELEDLKVKTDATWITTSLSPCDDDADSGENSAAGRAAIINYRLEISSPANTDGKERAADVTISTNRGKSVTLSITQDTEAIVINYDLSDKPYQTTAPCSESMLYLALSEEYIPAGIMVEAQSDWVKAELLNTDSGKVVELSVGENPGDTDRNTTVLLSSEDGRLKREISLTQSGWAIITENLGDEVYYDRNASNYAYAASVPSKFSITCDADWVSAYLSADGRTLNITVSECNANRKAVIRFSGASRTITVCQTKYKVGQTYSEDGVTGVIYKLETGDRTGKIGKYVGEYQWATVNAVTGANSSYNGVYNMEAVTAIPNWKSAYPAFAAVDALNTNGAVGWYLPSSLEVREMNNIVFSDPGSYNSGIPIPRIWSSTETSDAKAVCLMYVRNFAQPSYLIDRDLNKDGSYSVYASRVVDLFRVE